MPRPRWARPTRCSTIRNDGRAWETPASACATATAGSVRIGIHTGEVEKLSGDDVAGIGVHIGARVAAKARSGEILVSSVIPSLVVGSDIEFAERGVETLKGVPGEWRLYAVTSA